MDRENRATEEHITQKSNRFKQKLVIFRRDTIAMSRSLMKLLT